MEDIELSPEARREQDALRASTQQMRVERLELEAQNNALQALIERERRLSVYLKEALATSRAERQAIESEKSRLLQTIGSA
ncbi:hypothetical protein [Armatimonas sp.]|uniref:hypothetical protein n=1 Tax=Armatimonas sp. TaxID=1872638 RepID=UPI00286C1523|nr:hypothetical protein [Armatimonas sp.]